MKSVMNEQFEFEMKALIKQAKKLFSNTFYVSIFFIIVLGVLITLKMQNDFIGVSLFTGFLAIVFLAESLYGFVMYRRFKWIILHYQENKQKSLELLKKVLGKHENIKVDFSRDNIPFSIKLYMHVKKAYQILSEENM